MPDNHPAWAKIEPECNSLAKHHDLIPGEHAIELSKAISLKRIADAIDGTTLGVDISDSLAGITLQFIRKG